MLKPGGIQHENFHYRRGNDANSLSKFVHIRIMTSWVLKQHWDQHIFSLLPRTTSKHPNEREKKTKKWVKRRRINPLMHNFVLSHFDQQHPFNQQQKITKAATYRKRWVKLREICIKKRKNVFVLSHFLFKVSEAVTYVRKWIKRNLKPI